jgi:hypothetical protein
VPTKYDLPLHKHSPSCMSRIRKKSMNDQQGQGNSLSKPNNLWPLMRWSTSRWAKEQFDVHRLSRGPQIVLFIIQRMTFECSDGIWSRTHGDSFTGTYSTSTENKYTKTNTSSFLMHNPPVLNITLEFLITAVSTFYGSREICESGKTRALFFPP